MRRLVASTLSRLAAPVFLLSVYASNRLSAWQCPDGSPPPCRGAVRAPAANSVAVLYFDNRSGDSSDAYLADGVTEEVITRLAGIERLTVRSRHLVRRYRGSELTDPAAIGRSLGVVYLVTGSVRRAGERLRVSAELIRASGGEQVWGRQFDQSGNDVFAIQEAVARDVAAGIVGRLVPAEQRALATRPTRIPAAHDAFLRGNFYLARRDSVGFGRAFREYETALRLDPAYTDALSRMAQIYGLSEANGFPLDMPRDSLIARAVRTSDEAVRRAPASAEAWIALALARHISQPVDVGPALAAARRAVQLDTTNAEARHQLAGLLAISGQRDSARVHMHRVLAIEPERPISIINFGEWAMSEGRYAEARRWLDSALHVDATFNIAHALLFELLLAQGDTAGARREAVSWNSLPGLRGALQFVMPMLNLRGADTTAIAAFRRATYTGQLMPPVVGCWVAGIWLLSLGDREGALLALEHTRRSAVTATTMQKAILAPLQNEPRFQQVLRESTP